MRSSLKETVGYTRPGTKEGRGAFQAGPDFQCQSHSWLPLSNDRANLGFGNIAYPQKRFFQFMLNQYTRSARPHTPESFLSQPDPWDSTWKDLQRRSRLQGLPGKALHDVFLKSLALAVAKGPDQPELLLQTVSYPPSLILRALLSG